jgi:hypothetical protein
MRVVQCLDDLQLYQQHVLNQQIREVFTNQYVIVARRDTALLHNSEARGMQPVCQCIS